MTDVTTTPTLSPISFYTIKRMPLPLNKSIFLNIWKCDNDIWDKIKCLNKIVHLLQ